MLAFSDQVAVITGAGRGIGRAIALSLGAEGATICLVGRNAAALEAVQADLSAQASRSIIHRADLTSDDDIRMLATRAHEAFGHLDILVHSHGSFVQGPVASVPATDTDDLYRTNVRSVYLLTQTLLPLLKARRGQIVFMNSSIVMNPQAELSHYAATKHALKALADSLRQELNPEGVRVLSVYPGRTATPRQAEIHALQGKPYRPAQLIQPEDVAFMVVSALKLARTAEVTDIYLRPMIKPP